MAEIKNPRTAPQALALWDSGEPVPAFEVESDGATQDELWGAAIDQLAGRSSAPTKFTKRERDVIASIVFVAKKIGWSEMVRRHIHDKSPAITIRKPAAEQKQKEAKTQENDAPAPGSTPGPLPGE